MVALEVSKEALCLRGLVETFGIIQVEVHCESQCAIHLAKITCITRGRSTLM